MFSLPGFFTRLFGKWQAPQTVTEPALAQVSPSPPETQPRKVGPELTPATNPRQKLEEHCYDVAKTEAIASGAPKANSPFLQTLEGRAGSIAQSAHVPPSEDRDQRRVKELAALAEDQERQRDDRNLHGVYHAAELKNLADLGPRKACPVFPKKFYYAALISISISTAPTFHDFFVGLDPYLKWVAGGVCALGVSLLIIHGILPGSPDETEKQTK